MGTNEAIQNLLKENRTALLQADISTASASNGICYDGIVDEAEFYSAENSPKVIFLLKETNGNDEHGNAPKDLSDWPYRDWLEHQQATQGTEPLYRTFHSLCMWLDVFYDCVDGRLMSFSEYRDNGRLSPDSLRKNLRRTAILNLKKTWGGGSTAWTALNSYLESKAARDVIRKQIELIQPNIVICGGQQVFDFAKTVFGAEEELLPTGDRDILYFKSNGALFLNFYHPACRMSKDFLYNYSADVFKAILEKGLC